MSEGVRKRNVISQKPAQNDNKVKPPSTSGDLAEDMVAEGRLGEFFAIIGTILGVGLVIAVYIKVSAALGF